MRRRHAGGCEDCIVFYFRSYDYAGRCKIYGITDLLQFIVKSTKWNCTALFTSILHFRTAVCTVLHICGQMTNLSNYHQCRFILPQDWSRTSSSTDAYSGSWRSNSGSESIVFNYTDIQAAVGVTAVVMTASCSILGHMEAAGRGLWLHLVLF